MKLGVLASGGGSNLQAILDACRQGRLDADVRVVISNNSDSMALERARRHEIAAVHLSSRTHSDPEMLDDAIRETLEGHGVELVVLAGYMKKLGPLTLERFRRRVLNIHPALLPSFGGQGMYGRRVHQAVIDAGETRTGVTIHLVDEEYDRGPVLAQAEVPVHPEDSAQSLAERVLQREHTLYVETLQRIATGELVLP